MRYCLSLKQFAMLYFLVMTSVSVFCQQKTDLEKRYVNETVYRIGTKFMKGTERLGFAELEDQFSKSEIGKELYLKAKKQRNTSTVFRVISLGTAAAMLSFASAGNRAGTFAAFGGQLAANLFATHYARLSIEQTDRALWQRNRDVLFH